MRQATSIICGTLTLLLSGLITTTAKAQGEVSGVGVIRFSHGAPDGNHFSVVHVNAWLDDEGVAHGTLQWVGDAPQTLPAGGSTGFPGGPALPYIAEVTAIYCLGDGTVGVEGVVIASPQSVGNGFGVYFDFTDNSAGGPDMINFQPIQAGNIIVGGSCLPGTSTAAAGDAGPSAARPSNGSLVDTPARAQSPTWGSVKIRYR